MQAVNKKMDPQKTLKTMQDFQKENMKMGMTEDMSKDTWCTHAHAQRPLVFTGLPKPDCQDVNVKGLTCVATCFLMRWYECTMVTCTVYREAYLVFKCKCQRTSTHTYIHVLVWKQNVQLSNSEVQAVTENQCVWLAFNWLVCPYLPAPCLTLCPVNDTLDDIFDESGDEEESQDIVNQVLDEIGIEISGKVRNSVWENLPLTLYSGITVWLNMRTLRNGNF